LTLRFRPLVLVASVLLLTPLLVYTDLAAVGAANDQWNDWARIAWGYFQPGVGVNPNTGLHYATAGWHFFTDWDIGIYIKAIVDAEKLGILPREGDWGADYRLEKVLSFLEIRELTPDRIPYVQYDAEKFGERSSYIGETTAHPSDCANLLLALDDLRRFRPELAPRINSLVTRYNFQKLAEDSYFSGNDVYPSYVAQGYWAFGYSTPKLKPLESLGGGAFVDVYGESLPKARVTSEPFALAILEDRSTSLYRTYADRILSAQQKRYEATQKLTAFSEGVYWRPHYYVYEWIVHAIGETWVVYGGSGKINAVPIAYTKIAIAFHAIYNSQYTSLLVSELAPLQAGASGFYEGRSEEDPRGVLDVLSDKTNGMILAAARYHGTQTTTTSSISTETTTTTSSSVTTTSSAQYEFELNIEPSSLEIVRGENGTASVHLTPVGEFAEEVTLAVVGVPDGMSYSLDQTQATPPATVGLHVTSSTETPLGAYTVNVTATGGGLFRLASAALTVRSRTTIAVQLSTQSVNVSETVIITGLTQPARLAAITLLVSCDGSTWTQLTVVNSAQDGSFYAEYSPAQHGACMIKARAGEGDYYLPSESDPVGLTVVPEFPNVTIAIVTSLMLALLLARAGRLKRRATGGSVFPLAADELSTGAKFGSRRI